MDKQCRTCAHTHGPWLAEPADMFGDHNIVRAYESGLAMQEDRLAIAAVVSNLRPADEVAANARLIASAPLMMERIAELERWLRCITDDCEEQAKAWIADGCDAHDAIRFVLDTSEIALVALDIPPPQGDE